MDTVLSVFVLMPFREDFDDVYLVIKDAVRAAEERLAVKLSCRRADEISKPGRITEQIITAINECDVLIADLTDSNPNVMYELGYGHALGKTTIIINQEVHETPFDVKDFRQILYDRKRLVKDCRPSLIAALCDVFGHYEGEATLADVVDKDSASSSNQGLDGGLVTPLRPSDRLVMQIHTIYLKLQVANKQHDLQQAKELGVNLRELLSRITVISGGDQADGRNTAGVIGNCAVQLELAELFAEAEDIYRRALGIFPDYAGLHLQYSDFLTDAGRYEEAQRELDRAVELEPTERRIERLRLKLAIARGTVTSLPGIAEELRKQFEAAPGDREKVAAYLLYLAKTNATVDELEEVCQIWKAAVPDGEKYLADRALGDLLAEREHDSESRRQALNIYEMILAIVELPSDQRHDILHNAATLHAAFGEKTKARDYWTESYRLDPTDPTVRSVFSQRLANWGELENALHVLNGDPLV